MLKPSPAPSSLWFCLLKSFEYQLTHGFWYADSCICYCNFDLLLVRPFGGERNLPLRRILDRVINQVGHDLPEAVFVGQDERQSGWNTVYNPDIFIFDNSR